MLWVNCPCQSIFVFSIDLTGACLISHQESFIVFQVIANSGKTGKWTTPSHNLHASIWQSIDDSILLEQANPDPHTRVCWLHSSRFSWYWLPAARTISGATIPQSPTPDDAPQSRTHQTNLISQLYLPPADRSFIMTVRIAQSAPELLFHQMLKFLILSRFLFISF